MGTLDPDFGARGDGEVADGDEIAAAPPSEPELDSPAGDPTGCGDDEYVPA